jgi:putative ABC transport system substrate-binding protein
MTRIRHVLQALLVCIVVLTELVPAFSLGPTTIVIVLSRDIAPYREALKGFELDLNNSKRPYRFVEYNVEAAGPDPGSFIERIRARRPALILTLGSAATNLVAGAVHDVPLVFSLVLPSTGTDSIEELRSTHENVAGASMQIPVATQFAKIREILPGARRIGVLYDPKNSWPQVESAGKVATAMGLELVALPVTSEEGVVQRMEEVAGRVDLLWSVSDSTVFTPQGLRHILLSTLRSRIPFVGLSPSFVKAGALLALSCSYEDVGRQSGDIALRILGGEEPARIPTAEPREISLSINMNTAKQITVAISEEIRREAEVFF